MVYGSCRHRVYPNQKQESLFKEYLGHSRFIYNNIIGEIEYNRRMPFYSMLVHHIINMWNPFLII